MELADSRARPWLHLVDGGVSDNLGLRSVYTTTKLLGNPQKAFSVHPDSQGRGVLVVLNDTTHETRDVAKTNTTELQTFKSPNAGLIGYVDLASVRFMPPPEKNPRPRYSTFPKYHRVRLDSHGPAPCAEIL